MQKSYNSSDVVKWTLSSLYVSVYIHTQDFAAVSLSHHNRHSKLALTIDSNKYTPICGIKCTSTWENFIYVTVLLDLNVHYMKIWCKIPRTIMKHYEFFHKITFGSNSQLEMQILSHFRSNLAEKSPSLITFFHRIFFFTQKQWQCHCFWQKKNRGEKNIFC